MPKDGGVVLQLLSARIPNVFNFYKRGEILAPISVKNFQSAWRPLAVRLVDAFLQRRG